ncbi:MAG: HAD-IA family hydrolase [Anaerolineae bacterium]|nr:HAD-IA family hydrolase [Anaerolineae bacterium]
MVIADTNARHQLLAICFDCGDTLVDEGSEVKDARGVTLRAELIPGAAEVICELKRLGYPLALVADGPTATFTNILTQHDLYDCFDAFAISAEVGVEKPDPHIFIHALDQLGIRREDYGRVVMVGNNLARDIKGANALGLISVWLDWAPRRSKTPVDDSEVPQHTIKIPMELLSLIQKLDKATESNTTP